MASATGPSTAYTDNYSDNAYCNTFIGLTISDGVATFSGGTVTNLLPGQEEQDAVTKGFVDGLSNPSLPLNSVQYNNMTFGGSANFTWGVPPGELTINGTIDVGSISISGGTINGLINPTSSTAIATKNYVDSFNSVSTPTYIQSDTGVTYTSQEMIGGIIFRNLETYNVYGVKLTDTTASASQLVSYISSPEVGYSTKFKIMNDNPDSNGSTVEVRDNFVLTLQAGAGVSFYPTGSFNIHRGYALDAYIVFTNVVTPAVTIVITSCTYSGLNLYLAPAQSSPLIIFNNIIDYLNYSAMSLQGNIIWNTTNNVVTSQNYSYTTSDIQNQLIIRNPSGVASDTLGSNINPRFLKQIITIQNISAYTVTINGQTNIWTLSPSPITIAAGYQCTMSLNTTVPTITSVGSYYNIANYGTTGGTGSGMTLTVNGLNTTYTITNGGTGYSTGILQTTNLTTSGATGLEIDCTEVNGTTGAIMTIQNIINYVSGGYQDGDILQINGGDGTARITLGNVNSIGTFYILSLGNGEYVSTDVVTVSGGSTGSGGQITLGSFINVISIGLGEI